MLGSSYNAKRFAGKPLRQPSYVLEDVPKAKRNLEGSTLYEIKDRQQFVDATAEMLLLCNQAMKRAPPRQNPKKTSKPLSLEYLADRLDIDDPLLGFMVRDRNHRLQGFISCTTFTNWQSTFRWDSMHEAAFGYDDPKLREQMMLGMRRFDESSDLSIELQSTVRCGDPYNEGIVWPRIAEISLLGALGCGKTLLQLMIGRLETMKSTRTQNYDYVALQATSNSVSFYESMGFVRVGALIENDNVKQQSDTSDTESGGGNSSTESEIDKPPAERIVSSPNLEYYVEAPGMTPTDVAKKFAVPVWDVLFLNQDVYKELNSKSRLMKGTRLFIPDLAKAKIDATPRVSTKTELRSGAACSAPKWYVCNNDDTPRMIAKIFGLDTSSIVEANRARLPELNALSRLHPGTKIQVSQLNQHEDLFVPYCHWSFPDDKFEDLEPSYMMVRKLKRHVGKQCAIEASLAIPITKYAAPPSSLFADLPKRTKQLDSLPGRPKRPMSGYLLFCNDYRETLRQPGMNATEVSKALSARWNELEGSQKTQYQAKHDRLKAQYQRDLRDYEAKLERFYNKHPEMRPATEGGKPDARLFNKVVKLHSSMSDRSPYSYFYVLTFIPDLQWCHLAPLIETGRNWDPTKYPKCEGRPIWRLVDESEGAEVDISSNFVNVVNARSILNSVDADKERWDIRDGLVESTPINQKSLPSETESEESSGGGRSSPSKDQAGAKVTVAKKRGRPKKSPSDTESDGSARPKKRGRPKKSSSNTDGERHTQPRRPGRPKKAEKQVESKQLDAREQVKMLSTTAEQSGGACVNEEGNGRRTARKRSAPKLFGDYGVFRGSAADKIVVKSSKKTCISQEEGKTNAKLRIADKIHMATPKLRAPRKEALQRRIRGQVENRSKQETPPLAKVRPSQTVPSKPKHGNALVQDMASLTKERTESKPSVLAALEVQARTLTKHTLPVRTSNNMILCYSPNKVQSSRYAALKFSERAGAHIAA